MASQRQGDDSNDCVMRTMSVADVTASVAPVTGRHLPTVLVMLAVGHSGSLRANVNVGQRGHEDAVVLCGGALVSDDWAAGSSRSKKQKDTARDHTATDR